jgi:RimJ/RimL family protein N-acetyltransferase
MCQAASFSVTEPLRDGRQIEIRAIRPGDRDELLAAFDRTSDRSRYRRLFGVRRAFSEQEVSAFVNVDFVHEVALVAVMPAIGRDLVVGGGRYIVVRPGTAEVAFTVVDEFQRQGIASALLRHLVVLARASGIGEFIAEVMPDNTAMLSVLAQSGLRQERKRGSGVVHITLQLV